MKLNLLCTDVCLPDYFSGDARPWLTVPVDGRTTFKALRDALHGELRMGAIGGSDPLTRDDSGPDGDRWFKAAHAAINRDIKPRNKCTRLVFPTLDRDPEDTDHPVQAFFVFVVAE